MDQTMLSIRYPGHSSSNYRNEASRGCAYRKKEKSTTPVRHITATTTSPGY